MIYWRRYGADYLVSTIGFTMEMDGAYGRLLDNYYEREGPLPADDVLEIARATKPSDVDAVRKVLALKFKLRAGHYHHERADAEIALAHQARENGGKHVGKSAKVTRTRTGKPTRTPSEDVTDTTTGEITENVSLDATETAQESTVQPSTPTAVQPSSPPSAQPGGEQSSNRRAPRKRVSNRAFLNSTAGDPPAPEPAAQPPHPRNGSNGHDVDWWETPAGIQRHGREQDITITPGQPWDEFHARVLAASGRGPWLDELSPDMRAKVEHWQVVGVHASG